MSNFHWAVRILSSFVMAFDLTCKISYYYYSSFLNEQMKDLYMTFLMVRPIAIVCLVLYNLAY